MAESGGVPVVITETELDELAARLGMTNVYPRSGRTWFFDDFANGIQQWRSVGSGTVAWDGNIGEYSGFSMRITSDPAGVTYAENFFSRYAANNPFAGIEVSVNMPAALTSFSIFFQNRTAGAYGQASVILTPGTPGVVNIVTNGGNQAMSSPPDLGIDAFHTIKLTTDFGNRNYSTLQVDDSVWDISRFQIFTSAIASVRSLVMLELVVPAVAACDTYIGHVRLTSGEAN